MITFALVKGIVPALTLIIGANSFENGKGIPALNDKGIAPGVESDVANVKHSLIDIRGAKLVNGQTLLGQKANLISIRSAMKVALNESKASQQVVFYYSGLGSSGTDSLPTLATWNSSLRSSTGDLAWGDVSAWCRSLVQKGARPVVIIDASFPASTSRGNAMPEVDDMRPRTLRRPNAPSASAIPQESGCIYFLAADLGGRAYPWAATNDWSGVFTDLLRDALNEAETFEQVRARLLATATTYCRGPQLADFFPGPRRVAPETIPIYREKPFGEVRTQDKSRDELLARLRQPVVRLMATNDEAIRRLRSTDISSAVKDLTDRGIFVDKTGTRLPDVIVRMSFSEEGDRKWTLEISRDSEEIELDKSYFDAGLVKRGGTLPIRKTDGETIEQLFTPGLIETLSYQCLEARVLRSAPLFSKLESALTSEFSVGEPLGTTTVINVSCAVPSKGILLAGSQSATGRYRLLTPDPSEFGSNEMWNVAKPATVRFRAGRRGRVSDGDHWTFIFVLDDEGSAPKVDVSGREFWEQRFKLLQWLDRKQSEQPSTVRYGFLHVPADLSNKGSGAAGGKL